MLKYFIILILIVAGVMVWRKFQTNKQKKLASEKDKTDQNLVGSNSLKIENVGQGGLIHLTNIGPEMEEFDLAVLARHVYKQGSSSWFELECDKGTEKIWLEIEEDDELEISIIVKKLKVRELEISIKDLKIMDEEEEGEFNFEGETFYLEESDSARFLKNGNTNNYESMYYWDFENDSGNKKVCVEKWSDNSYTASVSEPIDPSQVTVYSTGK
jgi:hypothetical protein